MSIDKSMFLLKYGEDDEKHNVMRAILDHPESTQSDLRRASISISKMNNPNPKLFDTLVTHPRARLNYNMREVVAIHPKTPKHVIDHILNDERYDVHRGAVAYREDATPEQLEKIVTDRHNHDASRAALEHPNIPIHILDKFSHHPDPYVSAAVADNPKATKEHLLRIAENHPYDAGGEVSRMQLKKRFNHVI